MIVSLSQLGRWLAERAEEGGAMILPETAAAPCSSPTTGSSASAPATRGAGRDGESSATSSPAPTSWPRSRCWPRAPQGHLTGVALEHFGLRGDDPQVWELGVKEVWRVPQPLDRIIHTLGWPLRPQARYREFGGSFVYPMGDDMLTIGMVIGLDYRDVELSAHDLLQQLKTHPKIRQVLEGGERLEWGARTIPGGGFHALPRQLHAPGLLLCGDGAGMVNMPDPQGHPLRRRVRSAGGRGCLRASHPRTGPPPLRLESYDDAVRSSFIWKDLYEVRDMRQVFGRGFVARRSPWRERCRSRGGAVSIGKVGRVATTRTRCCGPTAPRSIRCRTARSPSTSSPRCSRRETGHETTSPTTSASSAAVPPDVAELWAHLCPAQVYAIGDKGDDGLVTVDIAPSNCVQCGAISAKGGRLHPARGGLGAGVLPHVVPTRQ